MKHSSREEWLKKAVGLLLPRVKAFGKVPKKIHAIVSWPKGHTKAIGQCFAPTWTSDKSVYVTVSPVLKEAERVLDVLLHELIHTLGHPGHGPEFKKVAVQLGLTGHMRATTATPQLTKELKTLAKKLGPYPHSQMKDLKGGKKKGETGGPLTLVSPVEPGLTIYISPNRYEEFGAPLCPISKKPMEIRDKGKGYSKAKKEKEEGDDDGDE